MEHDLYILGMGCAHPNYIIPTKLLEDMNIGTTIEWIHTYIGIENRVTSLPIDYIVKTRNTDPKQARAVRSHSPTDLGVSASHQALERAGITAADVGLLICNCCASDQAAPVEAERIASLLGVSGLAYDVFSACPAFALQVDFIRNFDSQKLPEYVLCVSTAALTQKVNYNDRTDGAIWGDGAAAWVMSTKKKGKLKVMGSTFDADPTRSAAVVVDSAGHFHQDGRAVRDFSVRQTVRMLRRFEKEFNIDWNKDIFVGHQANRTMLRQICDNRKIPDTHHWHNVEQHGNQAGASAPAVIAQNWERIAPGQRIAIAVVGAGLSWGSVLLEGQ